MWRKNHHPIGHLLVAHNYRPRHSAAMHVGGPGHCPLAARQAMGSHRIVTGRVSMPAGSPGTQACPSVMINPAVDPARDLARYIGEQTTWQNPEERFYFLPEYIAELQALDLRGQPARAPELAIIAKGDEVLDWREMTARYPQAKLCLLEGGEHALSDFEDHLPRITRFLALA